MDTRTPGIQSPEKEAGPRLKTDPQDSQETQANTNTTNHDDQDILSAMRDVLNRTSPNCNLSKRIERGRPFKDFGPRGFAVYSEWLHWADDWRPGLDDELWGLIQPLTDEQLDRKLNPPSAQDSKINGGAMDLADGGKKSQATILIELAAPLETFHDAEGTAYAVLEVNGHSEVWHVDSKGFKDWLSRRFFEKTKKGVNRNSLADALDTIKAIAQHVGDERRVFLRVARFQNSILIDLCNPAWEVVQVSPNGYKVLSKSPIPFVRKAAMAALPVPVEGGRLSDLKPFINVVDPEWPLVAGWLLMAFHPEGPYPVLAICSGEGTGKTIFTRMIRDLIDPSPTPTRSPPKEEKDLGATAINSHVVAYDNLSGLQPWMSDAVCRLSTGGGIGGRKLYTDHEESVLNVRRPCILNGIDELATQSDLASRVVAINLPRIPDNARREESEMLASFEQKRPSIFGGLLDALVCALRRYPDVRLERKPRMADFARWATAAEPALRLADGAFMASYTQNLTEGKALALESSPVGAAVVAFMGPRYEWVGTPTALLSELRNHADDSAVRSKA